MKITLKRTSPQYRQKLSTIEIMKTLLCVSSLLCVISVGYNFIFNGTNYGIKAILIFVVSAVVSLLTDAISGKLFHRNDEGDNKILNTEQTNHFLFDFHRRNRGENYGREESVQVWKQIL